MVVGSSWLSTWLPFLQSENESRSPLLRQLGPRRLILVPIPSLVCTRIRHLYTSTGLLSTQERQSCIYRVGKPRDDCRTLAPARAAAPIKTPLLEVLSRCLLAPLSLSLSSSRPSSPREKRGERRRESGEEDSPPFVLSLEEEPGAVHVPTFDRTKDYRPNP